MLSDIKDPKDVKKLVDEFYAKINQDELLGPIFNDVASVNWPEHLPVMCTFWESLLLGAGTYQGAPFPKHSVLPVEQVHFERWLTLFIQTVNEHFTGPKADEAKWRAVSIADTFARRMGVFIESEAFATIGRTG